MTQLLDKPAEIDDGGDESCAAVSTCVSQATDEASDNLVVVVDLAGGAGPFSAAELDLIERYMADILDEVLG